MSRPTLVHCATTHRAGDPRIFRRECRTLAEAGYRVVYVVPHPRDETIEGVEILGVPTPSSGRERLVTTTRLVRERARAVAEAAEEAVIHLHDSDLLPSGFALKRAGFRVVYDAHEDTPKQMRHQPWIPAPLRPVAGTTFAAMERLAGRFFDGIVAAEPVNAARFPAGKTVLVRNYPIPEDFVDPAAPPYAERPNRLAYVGSITRVRGLFEMVEARDRLGGAELVLGGPFHPASLQAEIEGREGVVVRGWIGREAVAEVLGSARVGLVVLHPTPKYVEAYPTKLFEYMAAGLPVVASDFAPWRAIIDEARCGLCVDPLDVDALTEAVRFLLNHPAEAEAMGRRGAEAVCARYGWRAEGDRLVAFYAQLLGGEKLGA